MRHPRRIQDMAAEAVLIAGGGRAILLQIADERVGLGVARHSDFASRPLDRLRATLSYVYVQVYGTADERRFVTRTTDRAHAPVRADASDGRPAYSAFDRGLQLWVAATLYDTAIDLYERVLGPVPEEAAERIYREYAVIGTGLRMPEELWPADRAAFSAWRAERMSELTVTDEARRVARDLLHPRGPLWLRAVMPLARLVTAGLLDAGLREAFELPWSPARQRRFDAIMRTTRALWPLLPRGIRHLPAIRALRSVRRRMAEDRAGSG